MRILLLEGTTDVAFFIPILKKLYGFSETNCDDIRVERLKDMSKPICLKRGDVNLVVFHSGGKPKQKQTLVAILTAIKMGYLSDVEILGIARDIDQEHDVKNWVKSIITNAGFNVKEDDKFLIVEDLNLKIAVLGIGNYDEDDFNIPSFELKRELEAVITEIAKEISITTKFKNSLESLSKDANRRLKPKDVMHILAIAKDFDGDSMSGLYRKFIEELINHKTTTITEVLKHTKIDMFLETLIMD